MKDLKGVRASFPKSHISEALSNIWERQVPPNPPDSEILVTLLRDGPMRIMAQEIESHYPHAIYQRSAAHIFRNLGIVHAMFSGDVADRGFTKNLAYPFMPEFVRHIASQVEIDFHKLFPNGVVVAYLDAGLEIQAALACAYGMYKNNEPMPSLINGGLLGDFQLPAMAEFRLPAADLAAFDDRDLLPLTSYFRLRATFPRKINTASSLMGCFAYLFRLFHTSHERRVRAAVSMTNIVDEVVMGWGEEFVVDYCCRVNSIDFMRQMACPRAVDYSQEVQNIFFGGGKYTSSGEELEFMKFVLPMFFMSAGALLSHDHEIRSKGLQSEKGPENFRQLMGQQDLWFWLAVKDYIGLSQMIEIHDGIFSGMYLENPEGARQ